jgi:hypothetical protein
VLCGHGVHSLLLYVALWLGGWICVQKCEFPKRLLTFTLIVPFWRRLRPAFRVLAVQRA